MKFQLTSHAVDRFCSRIAPGLSYEDGSRELAALLLRATRCGQTERGQAVYALPHDPPAYAVVKLRGKRRDPGSPGAVVVTVLTAEQWHGEHDELQDVAEAYEDLKAAVPATWKPREPVQISAKHTRAMEARRRPAAPDREPARQPVGPGHVRPRGRAPPRRAVPG